MKEVQLSNGDVVLFPEKAKGRHLEVFQNNKFKFLDGVLAGTTLYKLIVEFSSGFKNKEDKFSIEYIRELGIDDVDLLSDECTRIIKLVTGGEAKKK